MSTRILVVDNHDSFVHTLEGYLQQLGALTHLVEADDMGENLAAALAGYDGVLISPGPGTPADAGASIPVVLACAGSGTPLLGVCLGHQAIAEAFGARIDSAPELLHGLTSPVEHRGEVPFQNIPSPFAATRYHSLAIVPETLPDQLIVTAQTHAGVIMGIAHRSQPIWGVQFHPESVLTEHGHLLLGNWLERTGLDGAARVGARLRPLRA